ncbi:MAG: hypothetical protein ISS34_01565 [Candidatus Omnitrophica bacterium]|nr:hypothetical protein [Candidatus Omnitrophota bacterium]
MVKKVLVILICVPLLFGSYTAASSVEVGEDVKAFLTKLEKTISSMNTYRCIMKSENWKGRLYERKVSRLQFKKPNLMRLDVLEGRKRGSTVLLNKEGKIRGRNSWGLKKTLKPTDKRLKNLRGYTFLNSSLMDKVDRLKRHILETGCRASLTEEEYDNKDTYRLHIDHVDTDNAVTTEDIWFEKATYIILKDIKQEGDKKVSDVSWRDFEIDIPLDDSLFKQ